MIPALGRQAPLVLLAILQTISQTPAQDLNNPPPAVLILDGYTVNRTVRWMPLVERWLPDFPELDPIMVLAVIAQESHGDPYAVSSDGYSSIGLMQIIPRSWTASINDLRKPHINVYQGMRILHFAIQNARGDVRLGLAYFNCSEESVHADKCGDRGGLNYADRVMDYWYPMIRRAIGQGSEQIIWDERKLEMLLECIL